MHYPVAVDALRSDWKLEGDELLAEYVERYRRLIERLCRILLSDSADAEDATQQTFLLAYQSLLAGTRPHNPRAWLCTIARRECWARDHRRRRERAVLPAEAKAEPDPAERTVLRAELAKMNAGLRELPARQRQAIVLRELAGLSYTQLASALEVSESAAEALLVRARRNLRDARLGLALLFPFPRPLRRLLRLGSGHARAAVGGVQAAKAVAVVTLVSATTVVAGSSVLAEPAGGPPPKAAPRTAPQIRHAVKTKPPHHAVSGIRPAVHRVARPRVALTPAKPAVSPARVRRPTAPSGAASVLAAGSGSPSAPPAQPVAPATSPEPAAPSPVVGASRPHATGPGHTARPPAPKPTPPTTTATQTPPPTTTTTEPDQSVPPPPPTDTTETSPLPSGGSPSPTPDAGSQGDTRPGNGYGDQNHDHSGDHHHGH